MLTTQDRYGLQVFDRRSARTVEFDKAIRIYCDTTGGQAKTDATQIVYWAERKASEFSSKGDRSEVFSLLRDGTLIGFALGFYVTDENLYAVDHMAIIPEARSMTAFDRFCDLIQGHVERSGLYIDYYVVEISNEINDVDPLLNAETLIRLLQIKGFRLVDCDYLTPSPNRKPPYVPIKAKLILHSTAAATISPAKLIAIIGALHAGLYKNWYKPFAEDFEKYCRHLREITEFVETRCGNREYIAMLGHPPVRGQAQIKDISNNPYAPFAYLIVVVVLAVIVAALTSWIHIGLYSVIGGALAVAICTIAIMAIWYDGAAKLVRYGIDVFANVFGKQK
jgi:hypothetical protein